MVAAAGAVRADAFVQVSEAVFVCTDVSAPVCVCIVCLCSGSDGEDAKGHIPAFAIAAVAQQTAYGFASKHTEQCKAMWCATAPVSLFACSVLVVCYIYMQECRALQAEMGILVRPTAAAGFPDSICSSSRVTK